MLSPFARISWRDCSSHGLIVLSTGRKLSRTRQVEADPAPGFSNKVNITHFSLRPRDLVSMKNADFYSNLLPILSISVIAVS